MIDTFREKKAFEKTMKLKSRIKTNSEANKRKETRKADGNTTISGKNFNAFGNYEIK